MKKITIERPDKGVTLEFLDHNTAVTVEIQDGKLLVGYKVDDVKENGESNFTWVEGSAVIPMDGSEQQGGHHE